MQAQKTAWAVNIFVLGYIVLTIGLLTLSPFDFQAFMPSEFWVVRASVADVSRNILLFLPFGMMLWHTFKRSHKWVLLCGFGLSLSIECAQLLIVLRTSNVIDLMTNSAGAGLGSVLYARLFSQVDTGRGSMGLALALMLVPLCWLNAFRSIIDPPAAWLAGINAIAGITLLQYSLGAKQADNRRLKYLPAVVWSAIALIPLFNTSPQIAPIIFSLTPVAIYLCTRLSRVNAKRCCVGLTVIGAAIVTYRTVMTGQLMTGQLMTGPTMTGQLIGPLSPNSRMTADEVIIQHFEMIMSAAAAAVVWGWSRLKEAYSA